MIGSTVGAVVDSWTVLARASPARRGPATRLPRITSSTEGAVIPRLWGRMRLGGNMVRATDFREETKTTRQRTGGGKGGGRTAASRRPIPLLRLLRGRALRRPDHRHRPHLGRRRRHGPRRRHLALASGRRDAGARSADHGIDGRGGDARLPRHGLCRLRGAAARALRQPAAAALLRGLPPARRP